ncbi:MAG: hypothetical protein FJX29_01625 [Alphaproteobacteria bacterium]|nr:hypothetical protein [Alphaproteobacteria bacterium]
MLYYLRLDQYSNDTLLFILFAVVLAGVAIGYMTDIVMKDRGFGAFGNGSLAVLGMGTGIYIRNAFFGAMNPGDLALTGIFAAAMATLLLLVLGVAKHWLQD